MNAKLVLPVWVCKEGLYFWLYFAQLLGDWEALGEDGITSCYDGVADNTGICIDQAIQAMVGEAEMEHIAWFEVFDALEDELGWQLCEGDDGITFLLLCGILALHALCALSLEGEGSRLVLEGLVVVADISRHGEV